MEQGIVEENDWRRPIIDNLSLPPLERRMNVKELKNFMLLHGALYYRAIDGALARCLGENEAQCQLHRVHDETCGHTLDITLYRRLQRLGCYWPNMAIQSQTLQDSCSACQAPPHHVEAFVTEDTADWRDPYLQYLRHGALPSDKRQVTRIAQKAKRFVIHEDVLYRISFGGDLL
ncbi:hypothetical protein BVC80_1601g88 [Macleaya cordata]|uniref:Integrase zinc-binding domain-containing protein n=1 Tax=Macleaya cordata TaxID=56857 RepID=A0A200QA17_MACCD|nr:hypothetical protein BVC80_1601g88 [Macleaya cordata]